MSPEPGPAGERTQAPEGPAGLHEVPCLFCGVRDEELRFRDGPFRVVRCRRCGLTYVTPRLPPERLHEMYQDEYWASSRASDFGYGQYLADAPHYLRTFRLRSRVLVAQHPRPGRVADVGCAAG